MATSSKLARAEDLQLLREIFWRRAPGLVPAIQSLGSAPLSDDLLEELRGVLADELVENGLWTDSEPTAYGRRVDDLIDLFENF